MSDKPYYEMLLCSSGDSEEFPGTTRIAYECPIPRCGHEVHYPARQEELGLGTVVRLGPERPEPPHLAWIYDAMWDHFTMAGHSAQDWLLALGDQEDAYEKAAGEQNMANQRAWDSTRHAQESLQAARDELADTRLALSETVGVLGRVKALLTEIAGMPANSYGVVTNLELIQQVVQPFDPLIPTLPGTASTEPCSDECAFLSYTCEHGRSGGEQPQSTFTRCASTTFCANWGFCSKCAPELSRRAQELYSAGDEVSTQAYTWAVAKAAEELGIAVPVQPKRVTL